MSSLAYRESLPPDVRLRYDRKIECISVDPYDVPANKFDGNVSKWPDVAYIYVVNYLIFSQSAYTKEELKKYKSLAAYKLFQDGWIRQILHKVIGELHLFRAKVFIKIIIINVVVISVSLLLTRKISQICRLWLWTHHASSHGGSLDIVVKMLD